MLSTPAKTKADNCDVKLSLLPVKVPRGRDDGAEVWIHRGYFERQEYFFVFPGEKESLGVQSSSEHTFIW